MKWEVVTNLYEGKNQVLSEFTLYNHGHVSMGDKGWELYFSQMPPTPILDIPGNIAQVIHINGDWFKMVPQTGFSLQAGDSVKVRYVGTGFNIKKTDAPMGAYFVFYSQDGKNQKIIPVSNLQIAPFVRAEQLKRDPNDVATVPTAESRFEAFGKRESIPTENQIRFIPSPLSITNGNGRLLLSDKWSLSFEPTLQAEATFLAKKLKEIYGLELKNMGNPKEGAQVIHLTLSKGKQDKAESYQLNIKEATGIQIKGSDNAGVFYGIQSLLSMLPLPGTQDAHSQLAIRETVVEDAPRFGYRGLQFDMSRNFQSRETIMRMLDLMAFYKLNRFLFYFMEDEGWRVEIPGLPELTSVGAYRQHGKMEDPLLHPSYGSGPYREGPNNYGSGFFTSDQFVEMLKYAAERHITVIPVINYPAHVRSAIKAMELRYRTFMKEGKEKEANEFRLIDPEDTTHYISAQGYHDNVICVGRESVYHFYDTAVKGIRELYKRAGLPMEIFHTGGDEAAPGFWKGSPMVQKLLAEHPEIKPTDKSLQAYCFKRISQILKDNGVKTIGGWEEAALLTDESGKSVPNEAFVGQGLMPYLWNNMDGAEDLGYKMANAGYEVVLCDISNCYLDFPYDKDPEEPGNYWAGFLETKDFYAFAPFDLFKTTVRTAMGRKIDTKVEYANKVRLKPEARKNIKGVQAQIWSETIKGPEMLEYYYLPRLIAFAETAWSKERVWEKTEDQKLREEQIEQGWNKIANLLGSKELERLSLLNGGYNYRVPLPGAIKKMGMLYANTEFPGLEIRYTTDGTEPTAQSSLYSKPVKVEGTVKLKCFVPNGKFSRTTVVY
ncbi:MAG: carbohydate-binding domain-containing protein [Marinilabiliales bacterium]|nr:carbohydate-binding domain-containing protein [Marinilabiliales bacterium]